MTNMLGRDSGHGLRRELLKALAAAVLAVLTASSAICQASAANDQSSPKELARLESDELILQVLNTGAFAVTMKGTGTRWLPDPWQNVPCRLSMVASDRWRVIDVGGPGAVAVSRDGQRLTLRLTGPDGAAVTTRLTLAGSVVHVAICDVTLPPQARLSSVEYPFRSFYLHTDEDNGYLALPSREGCLIPSGPVKLGTVQFWRWQDSSRGRRAEHIEYNPTMPFYGAQKDGAGYTAILETTNDFVMRYVINSASQYTFIRQGKQSPYTRIACAWPMWQAQQGKFGYERRMRFEFKTPLDYVGMAKAYRKEALARGNLVTLREKAKARPHVDRLAGAPYLAYYVGYPHLPPGYPGFEHTYKQLGNVVDDLAGPMGLKRAFVHFWGAYSVQPPGCLPFDRTPGPVNDLAAVVTSCKQKGFLFTLYNDISAQLEETDLWMPDRMKKTRTGEFYSGYRWTRTCPSQYVDLLSHNLPEAVKMLGLEACYIDCINHGHMEECYHPNHPLTRTEDRRARMALYEYVHSLGLLFGGESGSWWNPAALEYTNGVGVTAGSEFLLRAFSVPLYHLVFHDALIPFCNAGDDYTAAEGTSFEDKVLRDLLRGIPPMFFMNLRDHKKWRRKILDSYAIMSDPAAAVMYDEMLTHQWLTDDQMVQRTKFASGVEITVNFDEIPREGLPGKGYRVSGLKDGPRQGGFVSAWE